MLSKRGGKSEPLFLWLRREPLHAASEPAQYFKKKTENDYRLTIATSYYEKISLLN